MNSIKTLGEIGRGRVAPVERRVGRMVREKIVPRRQVCGTLHDIIRPGIATDGQAENSIAENKAGNLRLGINAGGNRKKRICARDRTGAARDDNGINSRVR